jgi:Tfp pilus assembly protein PilZ
VSSTQPRYPVSLPVALSAAEKGAFFGEVVNISAGGMFVRSNARLPIGAVVSASLQLPDGDRPAPVEAKIVHVVASSSSAPAASAPGFGVQFVRSDDAFLDRMNRYIASIQRASKAPLKVLLIARDLLFEEGWTQFSQRDPQGSYCLTGALERAAGDDRGAYLAALQSLGPHLGVSKCQFGGFGCHCAVLTWNDSEGRTKREVVAKLDEVIEAALAVSPSA